jgi:16S rRNA (adenine1518-N6/adenine1519-N6)-dimethyltransferase
MQAFAPKKRFSQNFLTDQGIAVKIVAALQTTEADTVIEIGPGGGALTKFIVQTSAGRIIAVDADERSITALNADPTFRDQRLELVKADILRTDLSAYQSTSGVVRVIGNIPYAITSEILFWLFEQRHAWTRSVIMMQREVAERLVAQPRTKAYGILTLATWYVSAPRMLFHVKPGSFFPRPDVTSAVVSFDAVPERAPDVGFASFMRVVRSAFSQRRKTLANSLGPFVKQQCGMDMRDVPDAPFEFGTVRAEELSPETFIDLARWIQAHRSERGA